MYLSSMVSCLANSCYESLDVGRLENLIYFNQTNPYLHQICGKFYSLKKNHQKADFHFDKAIQLNIQDGGWTLTTKALNNMFDAFVSRDAITSLECIVNNEIHYELQNEGEIQNGIFIKVNEYGFSSFYIDLRSDTTKGEISCMMSLCYFKLNLLDEAEGFIKEAIKRCPDRDDFKELDGDIRKEKYEKNNRYEGDL